MKLLAKRTLAVLLSVLMIFAVMAVGATSAFAAESTLYLAPSANWADAGARFAAYFFAGETNTWVDMAAVEGAENLYSVAIPEGEWEKVIFCRMNPETTENNWNDGVKWNQTDDLDIPTDGKNCCVIDAEVWDKASVWATYADGTITTDPTQPAETVAPGTNVYTVAGYETLCGSNWDPADANNDMTNDGNGVYTKVYENVPAGTYRFKVVTNHSWDNTNYGDPNGPEGNFEFTVVERATVTIKFEEANTFVSYEIDGDKKIEPVEGTAYFVNTLNWANVSAHIWVDGQGGLNEWPGEPATVVDAEKGVYSFELKGATHIIFNDGVKDFGKQTGNLLAYQAVDKYYDPDSEGFYATADEAIKAAEDTTDPTYDFEYFVVGTEGLISGGWSETPRSETALTKGDDGIYRLAVQNVAAGSYEIKAKGIDGKWYPDGMGNNTIVNVNNDGSEVIITFDPAEGFCRASVTGQEEPTTESAESTVPGPKEYTIVGYINGVDVGFGDNDWQTVVPEYTFKDGKVTITFEQDSYIFVKTTDNQNWYNTAASSEGPSDTFFVGGPEKMKVPAGTIEFTLVENEDGSLTVSYAPAEDPTVEPTEEPTTEATEPPTKAPSLSSKGQNLKAGATYKVKVKNANGAKVTYKTDKKTVATVDKNGKVTALRKGTAKITVTVGKKKLTFTAKVTSDPSVTKKVTISKKGRTAYIKISGKASAINNKYTLTKSGKKIVKVLSNTKASKVKIKGLKKGTTTLTIKVNGVKSYKVKVTVKK